MVLFIGLAMNENASVKQLQVPYGQSVVVSWHTNFRVGLAPRGDVLLSRLSSDHLLLRDTIYDKMMAKKESLAAEFQKRVTDKRSNMYIFLNKEEGLRIYDKGENLLCHLEVESQDDKGVTFKISGSDAHKTSLKPTPGGGKFGRTNITDSFDQYDLMVAF